MPYNNLHTFHIPVMGLAYTIDSPIKVARFGINSVMSIIEDNLVEKMRWYYYNHIGEHYHPITTKEPDYRARRITDYLNLVNRIVQQQIERLRDSAFETGSEIKKYFEMLPGHSLLQNKYFDMMAETCMEKKKQLENWLREQIVPGSIDVNIMTKVDKQNFNNNGEAIEDGSDAVAALRGFAKSSLTNSSVILSAGMNPRLFSYMEKLDVFDADAQGIFQKKIVIKVSDFRSAMVQGKVLAKKGLWVSEFRIESGLNCGGHAFATDGILLGTILEEFKAKRVELEKDLIKVYEEALAAKGKPLTHTPGFKITVQGGIGTNEEDKFLHEYYGVDGTGWGTPFLLVPEATTVDDHALELLRNAGEQDVSLSKNSPLGIRFYYLKGTTSEIGKIKRIAEGSPGVSCTEKFLVSNTEFSSLPICTASHTYQKKKIEQLQSLQLSADEYQRQLQDILDKECLCVGLSNSAVHTYALKPFRNQKEVNVCPGPNIAYFNRVVSLQKMIDHIYGRDNVLPNNNRPHMFVKELLLYIDYFFELLHEAKEKTEEKQKKLVQTFYHNMMNGIKYYHEVTAPVSAEAYSWKEKIKEGLNHAERKLADIYKNYMNEEVFQVDLTSELVP